MPARSVARMIISPFFASTGTPSTSMLTTSSVMYPSRGASGRARSQLLGHQALAAVIDHVLELVAVVLQETLHRPRRGVTEGADGVPFDAVGDVEQQPQILAPRFAGQHSLQQPVHPAGAFAARRALAAGLGLVEA